MAATAAGESKQEIPSINAALSKESALPSRTSPADRPGRACPSKPRRPVRSRTWPPPHRSTPRPSVPPDPTNPRARNDRSCRSSSRRAAATRRRRTRPISRSSTRTRPSNTREPTEVLRAEDLKSLKGLFDGFNCRYII